MAPRQEDIPLDEIPLTFLDDKTNIPLDEIPLTFLDDKTNIPLDEIPLTFLDGGSFGKTKGESKEALVNLSGELGARIRAGNLPPVRSNIGTQLLTGLSQGLTGFKLPTQDPESFAQELSQGAGNLIGEVAGFLPFAKVLKVGKAATMARSALKSGAAEALFQTSKAVPALATGRTSPESALQRIVLSSMLVGGGDIVFRAVGRELTKRGINLAVISRRVKELVGIGKTTPEALDIAVKEVGVDPKTVAKEIDPFKSGKIPTEIQRIPEQASEKVSPVLDVTDNAVKKDGTTIPAGLKKLEEELQGGTVDPRLAEGLARKTGDATFAPNQSEFSTPAHQSKIRNTLSKELKIANVEADAIVQGKSIDLSPQRARALTSSKKVYIDDVDVTFTSKEIATLTQDNATSEALLLRKNILAKQKKLAKFNQRPDDTITPTQVREIKKLPEDEQIDALDELVENQAREIAKATAPFYTRMFRRGVVLFTDRAGDVQRELRSLGESGNRAANFQRAIAGTTNKTELEFMDASNAIFKGLSNVERKMLDSIIQFKSIISTEARNPAVFNPADIAGSAYVSKLSVMQKENPAIFAKLSERADKYFAFMNKELQEFRTEGLLDEATFNRLNDPEILYQRRLFLQHLDPDVVIRQGNQTITTADSGIDKLATGSIQPLEKDSERLLYEGIARKNNRIFKNRANKALLDIARNQPDNEVIKLVPKELEGTTAPKGFTSITVFDDGKPIEMIMPDELGKQWVVTEPVLKNSIARVIKVLTLSDQIRFFATGINPLFGVANISRDIAQQFWATQGRSTVFPLFLTQTSKDIASVASDVLQRKGIFKDYINNGGGLLTLTRQGRGDRYSTDAQGLLKTGSSKVADAWNGLVDLLSFTGENSELVLRVSMYKRALDNGKSKDEAINIARSYLDFNVGGSVTKTLDLFIPYLNAATQGSKALVKNSVENPGKFIVKLGQLGAASHMLYYWNTYGNDRKLAYDTIPDHVHEGNFIFMLPESFSKVDEDGNVIYEYRTIPVDKPIAAIKNAFEGISMVAMGDLPSEPLIKKTGKIFDALFPISKTADIPSLAILRSLGNYDTFTNQKIAMDEGRVEISEEFEPGKTSETAKFAADMLDKLPLQSLPGTEVFNLEGLASPQRLGTAFHKAVPRGILPDAIHSLTDATITRFSEEALRRSVLREHTVPTPLLKGITKRFAGKTKPLIIPFEERQSLTQATGSKTKLAREEADLLLKEIELGQRPKMDIMRFGLTLDDVERASVERHINEIMEDKIFLQTSMPAFFRTLNKVSSPENRAILVNKRFNKLSLAEKVQMIKDMELLGFFSSSQERFQDELRRLRNP